MSLHTKKVSSRVGTFSVIISNLLQHKEMSSDCLMEPCSDVQAEETGPEKQQGDEAEKEEVEVPCGDNQPAGSLGQEEPEGKQPWSPDHSGMQEATSESGLEQVQREETRTQKAREVFSDMSVNQESQDRGSGVCRGRWDVKCDVICYSCHMLILQHYKIQFSNMISMYIVIELMCLSSRSDVCMYD